MDIVMTVCTKTRQILVLKTRLRVGPKVKAILAWANPLKKVKLDDQLSV